MDKKNKPKVIDLQAYVLKLLAESGQPLGRVQIVEACEKHFKAKGQVANYYSVTNALVNLMNAKLVKSTKNYGKGHASYSLQESDHRITKPTFKPPHKMSVMEFCVFSLSLPVSLAD